MRTDVRSGSVIREWKIFAAFLGVFLFAYFVPLATPSFDSDASPIAAKVTGAIVEAFVLLQWYARNHTLACVVPALFIAGAITTFLTKESVLKHLGPKANKAESYSVASVFILLGVYFSLIHVFDISAV